LLTLLTDFGTRDAYVAAVKGTVLRRAPGTTIVDITHEVAPGDVEEAAFLLAAAAPSFPPETVHLAVVDPGVGGDRALLAVEHAHGRFVAPNNGLLTPAFTDAAVVITVERQDLFAGASTTFHGRDRFAPIAAALLVGEPFHGLGRRVTAPVRLELPAPQRSAKEIVGRVAHVDRFGNLVTDIPADWVDAMRRAAVGGHVAERRASHYAELAHDEAGWLVGSLGTVELSLRDASLAGAWGVQRGAVVRMTG
jgi:S-adenosylmethionine hydrolase